MSAIRHDGYAIRDLSFNFSLIVFGIKHVVENSSKRPGNQCLYQNYLAEFDRKLKSELLTLAINFRAMDDEIRENTESFNTLNNHYHHRSIAFSALDEEIGLREVCNKIIHSRKSYWCDKNAPNLEQFKRVLSTDNVHDLIVIEGSYNKKPWVVGIDLIALAEQFYEYAEVACEYCGA